MVVCSSLAKTKQKGEMPNILFVFVYLCFLYFLFNFYLHGKTNTFQFKGNPVES